jgi:hypothetical protein
MVVGGQRVLVRRTLTGLLPNWFLSNTGEMIGVWTLAIERRIPLAALAGMIVPYPTLAEAAKRAAGSRFADRLFASRTRRLARLLLHLP